MCSMCCVLLTSVVVSNMAGKDTAVSNVSTKNEEKTDKGIYSAYFVG